MVESELNEAFYNMWVTFKGDIKLHFLQFRQTLFTRHRQTRAIVRGLAVELDRATARGLATLS